MISGVQPRIEPFLPVALLMAGAARRDLIIEGPVHPEYVDTLRLGYIPLLRAAFGVREVSIESASSARPEPKRTPGTRREGLLFSAGVDSLYSLIRLRELHHPPPLLINVNAGSHGPGRVHADARLGRITSLARDLGLGLLTVDTNFHEVVEIGHEHGHPFRTVAAANTLLGALSRIFMSTAYAFHQLSGDWTAGRFYMEQLGGTASNTVRWHRVPLTEVGYDKTRFEKTVAVAAEPLSYQALDVCIDPGHAATFDPPRVNRGECSKCAITLLSLELTGRIDRYSSQFDLAAFRSNRDQLLQRLREHDSTNGRDILARLDGVKRPVKTIVSVPAPAWAQGDPESVEAEKSRAGSAPVDDVG